jgi:hypothetical protein
MTRVNRPEVAFQQIQHGFAEHIRSSGEAPAPADVPAERMAVYRELFFSNVSGFLAEGFPVLRQVMSDAHWQAMARDFYARHSCQTPLFTCIGEEFLAYLRDERGEVAGDPPFLAELAHYEWVELALTLSDEPALPTLPAGIELSQQQVRLSPLAWPLQYRFPVHRVGADDLPTVTEPEPVQLLVYRDRKQQVVFLEIDLLTHTLLSALQSVGEAQVGELLQALAEMTAGEQSEDFTARGIEVVAMLSARGVIGPSHNDNTQPTPAVSLMEG